MAANKAPATRTPSIEGTAQELAERINALAAERMALYRQASSGWTPAQAARVKAINEEMAALWEARRRAQAGRDDDDVPVRHVA
jgi:hypothetical protein